MEQCEQVSFQSATEDMFCCHEEQCILGGAGTAEPAALWMSCRGQLAHQPAACCGGPGATWHEPGPEPAAPPG